jgi:hypothetical protein
MDPYSAIHHQRHQRRGSQCKGGSVAVVSEEDGLLRRGRSPRLLHELERRTSIVGTTLYTKELG